MASATTKRRTASEQEAVRHLQGCPGTRVESYDVAGPGGQQRVTRCVECGAAIVNDTQQEVA